MYYKVHPHYLIEIRTITGLKKRITLNNTNFRLNHQEPTLTNWFSCQSVRQVKVFFKVEPIRRHSGIRLMIGQDDSKEMRKDVGMLCIALGSR